MIEIPDAVRRTSESRGAEGRAWLATLPARVDRLRRAWSLTIGEALPGGTTALVLRVRRADGTDAVLKIAPAGSRFAEQVRTMVDADGHGYALVYRHDLDVGAALLEPLGVMLTDAGLPMTRQIDILTAVLPSAWRVPRPPGATVRVGDDKGSMLLELITSLWTELGRPCSSRLIDAAAAAARKRIDAFNIAATVVCHGDAHPSNALAIARPRPGAESGFVLIDPDPLLAEPEYDLGVALRGWTDSVFAADDPRAVIRRHAERMAATTGLDADVIEEWAFIERVSTGLYLTRYGHPDEGAAYLATAELLTAH